MPEKEQAKYYIYRAVEECMPLPKPDPYMGDDDDVKNKYGWITTTLAYEVGNPNKKHKRGNRKHEEGNVKPRRRDDFDPDPLLISSEE